MADDESADVAAPTSSDHATVTTRAPVEFVTSVEKPALTRLRRAARTAGRERHGEVRPWLLLLLRAAPAHGYELQARLGAHGVAPTAQPSIAPSARWNGMASCAPIGTSPAPDRIGASTGSRTAVGRSSIAMRRRSFSDGVY